MLDKHLVWDYAYVAGPLAVLSSTILSLLSSAIWSRNVGETSCAWRTSYSPDGRAFAIWGAIYIGTVTVAIAQLTGNVPVFDWGVSLLWSLSWTCCSLWVPLFDAESPGALLAAMLAILLGAACATGASWFSEMWRLDSATGASSGVSSDQRLQHVVLGLPLTILAGWLTAASAINVGIAWKANNSNASKTCVRIAAKKDGESESEYRNRRRVKYREAYALAPVQSSIVPLLLAAGVGLLSFLMRDPVYPVPLIWAILNLAEFPSCVSVASLFVCVCGSAGAISIIFA